MKVFLVGGFGFIGKRFIRKFTDSHEITVYATKQDIQNANKVLDLEKISIEEGLVEEQKLGEIVKKHNPDVVVHLAALTGLVKCHNNPEDAFKINVYGTHNVVNACIRASCKLIFISSREVYGETINDSSKEDDPMLPNNVYGLTKKIGEDLIRLASQKNGLDYTILRLTNVYGPDGDQYGAQVIIKKAISDGIIPILGGTQRLNYVYVDDVVDVINLVLDNEKSSKQIFNVGSKDTVTIDEYAKKVVESLGTDIKLEHKPMRETETSNFEPNLEKLGKVLGITPKTTLEDGIKNTIKWYSL